MTEKQFDEIRERARVFPYGVPSQVQTDVAELIAERLRVGGEFEPEPVAEEEPVGEEIPDEPKEPDAPRRTSGARKK